MLTVPMVFLPSPDREYLSFSELCTWLDLSDKTVRKHIREGRLPNGTARKGGRKLYWRREVAAVSKWIIDNRLHFNWPAEPTDDDDGKE